MNSGGGRLPRMKVSMHNNLEEEVQLQEEFVAQCVCNYHAQCARIENVSGYEPSYYLGDFIVNI